MKVVAFLAFFVVVAYASADVLPQVVYDGQMEEKDGRMTNLEDVDTDAGLPESSDLTPIRHRRVTCDLLSFTTPWGGVNHAACAARCLAQRHKGGACQNGVCVCRD
ncbi:defensin-2 [Diprion similis]|uniref:defensin-2 n=1 Tax=Diprion similis TaxID=362088 RepID=UPI001EF81C05|nr:defensin-2 [Diprion similis]